MNDEKSEIAMIVKSGLSDISCHGVNSERVSGLKVIKKTINPFLGRPLDAPDVTHS